MKKWILLFLAILLPLTLAFIYCVLYSIDGSAYSGEPCNFYTYTGLDCPGCGGQRAMYYLLHGAFYDAIRYNLLFSIGLPVALVYYFYFIRIYIFKEKRLLTLFIFKPVVAACILGAILLFFLLRNIPIEPFTYLNAHF